MSIERLGRYEIQGTLGKGAMGVVYLARDPIIDRRLALKTLRVDLDAEMTEEFRERFFREARAAGRLSHPGIVTVHDVGEDAESGLVYIAMEYIEGRNLKQVLASGEPIRPSEAARIVAEVATALDYAHSMGVVHRDIKPANIILTPDGTAKITDFGVARLESSNLTVEGQFIGTPNFMSPEQITGGAVDGRSDLFSLGVVFFYLLTGTRPFTGGSMHEVTLKIVQEQPPIPTAVAPGLPAAFNPILFKCLEKSPERRFQTGGQLAAVLGALARSLVHRETTDSERTEVHSPDLGTRVDLAMPTDSGETAAEVEVDDDGEILDQDDGSVGEDVSSELPPAPDRRVHTAAIRTEQRTPRLVDSLLRRLPIPQQLFWEVRTTWAGSIIAVLLLATVVPALILARAIDPGPWPAPPVEAVEARTEVVRTLRAATAALDRGDLIRAEALCQEALSEAPSSPGARRLMTAIRAALEEEETILETREQTAALVEAGREDYRSGRITAAIETFEEALELDPDNELAANYLELAQDRMRAIQQSPSETRSTPPTRSRGRRTAQPDRAEATPLPTPTPGRARITLYFNSPVNSGLFEVEVDGQQATEVPFDFTRKNLLGMRRAGTGTVRKVFTVPSGDRRVTIRLTSPDLEAPAEQVFRQRLPDGSDWSLRVDLPRADGAVSFYLIPIR